jgi:hypothetical protein
MTPYRAPLLEPWAVQAALGRRRGGKAKLPFKQLLHSITRREDACALFKSLLALCNDVGLLAEEYDPRAKRMLGNFPQAFSHVGLISTALNLNRVEGPYPRA